MTCELLLPPHRMLQEQPEQLRSYTGHDTLAFLYHHYRTGFSISPVQRVAGAGDDDTESVFRLLYCKAREVRTSSKCSCRCI